MQHANKTHRISVVVFSQIPVDSEAGLSKLFKKTKFMNPSCFFLSLFCNAFYLEKVSTEQWRPSERHSHPFGF